MPLTPGGAALAVNDMYFVSFGAHFPAAANGGIVIGSAYAS